MYLEVGSTVANSWVLLHLLLAKMLRKQGRHMDSLGVNSFAAAFGGRSYRKYSQYFHSQACQNLQAHCNSQLLCDLEN